MIDRTRARRWLATGSVVLCLALVPPPAAARSDDVAQDGPLISLGAMLCTLVYSPVKIAYAASGVAVGSLAWAWSFGSSKVAKPIFRSALGGDYVVVPDHLRGRERLRFRGGR